MAKKVDVLKDLKRSLSRKYDMAGEYGDKKYFWDWHLDLRNNRLELSINVGQRSRTRLLVGKQIKVELFKGSGGVMETRNLVIRGASVSDFPTGVECYIEDLPVWVEKVRISFVD